jgi:thiamine-monophosphate kinase
VVTGTLGSAAAGYRLSVADSRTASSALSETWGREIADALARPVARVGEGQTLAQAGATAMIDVSDGLAKDLGRLCRASGLGCRLELTSVPVSPAARSAALALGFGALEVALGGGEDYELLATLPRERVDRTAGELQDRFGVTLTTVGTIIEGTGAIAVGSDGEERPLEPIGWDHFA